MFWEQFVEEQGDAKLGNRCLALSLGTCGGLRSSSPKGPSVCA